MPDLNLIAARLNDDGFRSLPEASLGLDVLRGEDSLTYVDAVIFDSLRSELYGRQLIHALRRSDERDYSATLSRFYERRHSSIASQVRIRETIMRQIEREKGEL